MRIVSLQPSATEIVCALGLEHELVGVSHECDYPPSVDRLPAVTDTVIPSDATSRQIDVLVRKRLRHRGGLYSLDGERLDALRPDVIVTQTLCEVCAVAEDEVHAAICRLPEAPQVVNLEPERLSAVLDSIRLVARAAGVVAAGEALVASLEARVARVVHRVAGVRTRPRVVLLEWLDPPFSCGHWSPELVRLAGGLEALGREGEPSRTVTWEDVRACEPEVIVVACCGFDVERARQDLPPTRSIDAWADMPAVRSGHVYVVNGSDYFSRPGPRVVDSLEMLAYILHHDVCPLPDGLPVPERLGPGSA
jgi:iron complex transport system substrate-binding protein